MLQRGQEWQSQAADFHRHKQVGVVGFGIDEVSRAGIQQQDFLYTDLIAYPQLISFYSARKIAAGLGAAFQVYFTSDSRQRITIAIPLGPGRPVTQ